MQANSEEWSSLQGSLTLSYTESSKWLQRDQHKTWLKFWCGKNTGKATTWYMQFLKSYCIHLVEILMSRTSLPEQLQHYAGKYWCIILFTRAARCCHLNMTYFKRSKRSDKGQHQTCPRFWCGQYLCKIKNDIGNSCRVSVHKAAWPWASLKVQKGHTKVNVNFVRDFYVENIHVKLQHDTGNLRRVIAFTRFRIPPVACPPRQRQYPPA